MNRGFGSDNHATVHEEILTAISAANFGHAPAYGTDELTTSLAPHFQEHFGASARAFFVFNGTAANILCLRSFLRPHEAVIAADTSHLNLDECGALEFHGGNKILSVPSLNGKITPEGIAKWLTRLGDQHMVQPRMVSITQPTEWGTVYSLEELKTLRQFTNEHGLLLHVDGARFANAAVSLGVDLAQLTRAINPNALSLGGTKNGLMGAEAVVLFNEQAANDFKYLHKQEMQLPSKTRFLAAQFKAYLQNDLWRRIAQHSLSLAQIMAQGLEGIPGVSIVQNVQSNAVFMKFPKAWTKPLKDTAFFYIWDEDEWIARLMFSHDSQIDEIERFIKKAKQLSQE